MEETRQVIVMRRDLNMPVGKIAAQACHASNAFITKNNKLHPTYSVDVNGDEVKKLIQHYSGEFAEEVNQWIVTDFTKIVVGVDSHEELLQIYNKAMIKNLKVHLVTDNGKTCFDNKLTDTCICIGPHKKSKFIGVTDKLKLL